MTTPTRSGPRSGSARTDSIRGLEFDNPTRPEAHNLLILYQLLSGLSREDAAAAGAGMSYSDFKDRLTEAINTTLTPIRRRYAELRAEPEMLLAVLDQGRRCAAKVAERTLARVAGAMGFVRCPEDADPDESLPHGEMIVRSARE